MAFVNLSLLAGGSLVAIPIILHLVMRQKPKRLVFPALQFVRQRRVSNTRRLQLRHFLLLLLRCLAIAAPAAALARPSVAAAALGNWLAAGLSGLLLLVVGVVLAAALIGRKSRWLTGALAALALVLLVVTGALVTGAARGDTGPSIGDQEAPVAAVLVIDTSPRMQYRHENQTRLDRAKQIAKWLLGQLPEDSSAAVVDSRAGAAVFAADISAARNDADRLELAGAPRRFADLIEEALRLVEQSEQSRKEIYIITDLAKKAWDRQAASSLAARLRESPHVQIYVIDVGVAEPVNVALGELELSAASIPAGGELRVAVNVTALGAGGARVVELHLEEPDPTRPVIEDGQVLLPESRRRGQQSRELQPGSPQQVEFVLKGLELGVHHGRVQIVGQDGLPIDDVRHFCVRGIEPSPVLVVAPRGVNTYLLTEALAPESQRQRGEARFQCDVVDQGDLAEQSLENYDAVCLLDPEPLAPVDWQSLAAYVRGGGGAAIFLGPGADSERPFDVADSLPLLGGTLDRVWRAGSDDLFLDPRRYEHPVLADFRPLATSMPWSRFPVFMHWGLKLTDPSARVIAPFGNGQPAIIEKTLGQGRVIITTTPFTEPSRPAGRSPWNELALGNDWPRLVLLNLMMRYLAQENAARLNYHTGEAAVLPNRGERDPERYQLFTPGGEPQDLAARDGQISVRFTEQPGAYRLKGFRGRPVVRGFSVNLPASDTDLSRATTDDLDHILGADRYKLATNRDEIEREVGEGRVGREFYPYLVVVFALVIGLEHALANRFYRRED